jgi:hypothetical protein
MELDGTSFPEPDKMHPVLVHCRTFRAYEDKKYANMGFVSRTYLSYIVIYAHYRYLD